MSAPQQLPTLTGLRGIAALAVLFYHIRGGMAGFAPAPLLDLLAHGYLAVDLFFLLSGFVLWWTYGDAFRHHGRAAIAPFIIRRFSRIFPLHLAIMAAMVAFAGIVALSGRAPGAQYPLADLPAHLLLIQNWGLTERLAWNDPAWSISAEWAAYLWLALVGGGVARWRTSPWRFPLLVLALAGVLGAFFALTGSSMISTDIPATGLVRCLVEFTIGVLLCQWWSASRADRRKVWLTAALFGATGAALIASGLSQPAGVPLVMAALLIAALEAALLPRPLLGGALAQWLGRISYAVYLSHFFLWILFKLFLVEDLAALGPLAIGGFVAGVLLVSHALHHLVELPGRRLTQRGGDALLAAVRPRPARG